MTPHPYESGEPASIEGLKDFYLADAEEEVISQTADDVYEEPTRPAPEAKPSEPVEALKERGQPLGTATREVSKKDLGPAGKLTIERGRADGENNPQNGHRYETLRYPEGAPLTVEIPEIGPVTLKKVRTGITRSPDAAGGVTTLWGDGEFDTIPVERPGPDDLKEHIAKAKQNLAESSKDKTSVTVTFGGRELTLKVSDKPNPKWNGKDYHVYERRTFDQHPPEATLDLPMLSLDSLASRPLVKTKVVVKRLEINLDEDSQPPMGRAKFELQASPENA